MFGSTLLYPDTGSGFPAALRTSLLYADRIHLYSVTDQRLVASITAAEQRWLDEFGADMVRAVIARSATLGRLLEYCHFIRDNGPTFDVLTKEGILQSRELSTSEGREAFDVAERANEQVEPLVVAALDKLPMERKRELIGAAAYAADYFPPSAHDLTRLCRALIDRTPVDEVLINDTVEERWAEVLIYTTQIMANAELYGAVATTWLDPLQRAFHTVRAHLVPSLSGLPTRKTFAHAMAHDVLARSLPRADDLALEDLLRIRQTRRDELHAFRVGIAELASQVDIAAPDWELAAADIVARRIDPALEQLRAALYASRMNALRKIGTSASSAVAATIPAVISFAAGAPVSLTVIATILGGLAGPVVDSLIEQSNLRRASSWSLLLRLRQM